MKKQDESEGRGGGGEERGETGSEKKEKDGLEKVL